MRTRLVSVRGGSRLILVAMGLVLAGMWTAPGSVWAQGDSLTVHPPKHIRESRDLTHAHTFAITLAGFASRQEDLYVFQEGQEGCATLSDELTVAQDAQELYYRFAVHGSFQKRTLWDSFRDAGRHWACAYLAGHSGQVILHRYVPFTITAPSLGRLQIYPPTRPRLGRRYSVILRGFAAMADSLWIYIQHRAAGACRDWYAFHDSTYLPHHVAYRAFVVHGRFRERTSWIAPHAGRYRACAYLVETSAYPERIMGRSTSYRVS